LAPSFIVHPSAFIVASPACYAARSRTMSVEAIVPLLFFPTFAALWIGITFLIGATGGWRTLSKTYAATNEFTGKRWHMQSGTMGGFARYNNILTIGADARGLYLAVFALFRPGHPPLFIPWEFVRIQERRGWVFTYVVFSFPASPGVELALFRKLGEQVAAAGGRPLPVFA
jgi:hypothetical protein